MIAVGNHQLAQECRTGWPRPRHLLEQSDGEHLVVQAGIPALPLKLRMSCSRVPADGQVIGVPVAPVVDVP